MTSREKLEQLVHEYTTRRPSGMQEAALLLVAQQFGPKLLSELPTDPVELDGVIVGIAIKVLEFRSDDAPMITVDSAGGMALLDAPTTPEAA